MLIRLVAVLLSATSLARFVIAVEPPVIIRKLPPVTAPLPAEAQARVEKSLSEIRQHLAAVPEHPNRADVEIFEKALDYALRHGEFFDPKGDPGRVEMLSKAAVARADELKSGQASWLQQRGHLVRGYRSQLDDSVQPYGVVVPEALDLSKPVPLYVWLHGRGDTKCDYQFIYGFLGTKAPGPLLPPNAIVLHPFGRFCNGWKSAGEVDVFEAIENMKKQYPIDENRIVLAGFSMGGAGAWHLGAHYADRWCAVHAGAGFVDVRRYQNVTADKMPPLYEQKLWGLYDVPDYRRNLLNVPVLAYSGEEDKQKAAADIMEAELAAEGYKIPHFIGPGMGHKYHPDVLIDIHKRLATLVEKGRTHYPKKVSLQTKTLRYNKMFWVEALGLTKHWEDSRIDAEVSEGKKIAVATKNIHAFKLSLPYGLNSSTGTATEYEFVVDGTKLAQSNLEKEYYFVKRSNGWKLDAKPPYEYAPQQFRRKIPGLQGPIDDAFVTPFSIQDATTSRSEPTPIDRWVEFESQHFRDRWRMLMRGEAKSSPEASSDQNIVLWGTPQTNPRIQALLDRLPIKWTEKTVALGDLEFDARKVVPVLIYPNPDNPSKYIVLNSGLTFREGHDHTNSLQNPKLGDWAFIDVTEPPNELTPGKVLAAGFFDEEWKYVPQK